MFFYTDSPIRSVRLPRVNPRKGFPKPKLRSHRFLKREKKRENETSISSLASNRQVKQNASGISGQNPFNSKKKNSGVVNSNQIKPTEIQLCRACKRERKREKERERERKGKTQWDAGSISIFRVHIFARNHPAVT